MLLEKPPNIIATRIVDPDHESTHERLLARVIVPIAGMEWSADTRTSTLSLPACKPTALNSSASWSATRTSTGSATSAARRESSSS
jgi:hypothetical protein